jgi:hypothetical protein
VTGVSRFSGCERTIELKNRVNLWKAFDYLKREIKRVGKAIAAFEAVIADHHTKLVARDQRNKKKEPEGGANDRWPR